MRRFTRIEIDGNKTYLRYRRGDIQAIVAVKPAELGSRYSTGLYAAMRYLRADIQEARQGKRDADKLAAKKPSAVLSLLRQKRRSVARVALESKGPVNRARHVGVEIEFISSSDRDDIALDLAMAGVEKFVELKSDGSVHGDSDSGGDCDGSCRDNCECMYCGETHYCDNERECTRRSRNSGDGQSWEIREDCRDCDETETIDDCDCGGVNDDGDKFCLGEHVVCSGHCPGHSCDGYDDHPDADCDCECNCNTSSGHEIAIVAKSTQIAEVLTKVCKVLAQHDAEVNETCGLHVHIDMRGYKDVPQAFANLVKAQRLLYSMVPASRYKNRYCAPNTDTRMTGHCGRYWGINPASYSEHKTIEIRLHSGTVNAVKIINWIKLLQKIAYGKRIKTVNRLSDLTRAVKLPPDLLEYVKARISRFASEHGAYSLPIDTDVSELKSNVVQLNLGSFATNFYNEAVPF